MLRLNKELNRIEVDDVDDFNEYYNDLSSEYSDYNELYNLLEDMWCNGDMYIINPDEVGALTDDSNFMFSSEFGYKDDESDIVVIYNYYHCPNYAIINYIEELYNNGYIQFDIMIETEGIEINR